MDIPNETLFQQFSSLLDFSNDMSRNRDDAEWSSKGNEIIYVLDTSVLSSFIYPADWTRAMRVLSWHNRHIERPNDIAFYEGYSAMIAAEYLIAVDAPGSRSKHIFMSPWHGDELSNYIKKTYKKLSKKISDASKSKWEGSTLAKEVDQKIELVRQAREYEPAGENNIDRASITRKAAQILLNSEVAEPLDQIYRLTSQEIRNRFRTLDQRFPVSDEDLNFICFDAREWFERIWEEVELNKESFRRKSKLNVWSDALTISYLSWISTNKLRDDQRVVFVTADMGIFDVYRRWFITRDANKPEFYQPFIFRRLSQFAPLINLIDAKSDISDSIENREDAFSLFDEINNSIEMALIPFSLSKRNYRNFSIKNEMVTMRGREMLAFGSRRRHNTQYDSTLNVYSNYLPKEWYLEQSRRFVKIGEIWGQLQTAATGLFFELVKTRINDDFGISIKDIDALEKVGGTQLSVQYFQDLAAELAHESTESALEGAHKLVASSKFDDGPDAHRLPKTIWYEVNKGISIEYYLNGWRNGESQSRHTLTGKNLPETVFVLAASISLAQGSWATADIYSKRAINASLSNTHNQLNEIKFLRALCLRFNIGTISTHLEGFGGVPSIEVIEQCIKIVKNHYLSARDLLVEVIQYEERSNLVDKNRKLFRAKSELIALKLYYFSSIGSSPYNIKSINKNNLLSELAAEVRICIDECNDIIKNIEVKDDKYYEIENQFHINVAVLCVLEFLFLQNKSAVSADLLENISAKVSTDGNLNLANRSSVVRAEVNAFMLMFGSVRRSAFRDLEQSLVEGRVSSLALDRAICRVIEEGKGNILSFGD